MDGHLFPLPVVPPRLRNPGDVREYSKFSKKLYGDFFAFKMIDAEKVLLKTSAERWRKKGEERALQVFHAASERVPAYKDFLKKHSIKHKKIKTISDFQNVPILDKDSYVRAYPLEALCWDGDFSKSQIISVSSGSTGTPFLWPREVYLELDVTYFFELILHSLFKIAERRTLVVDCFAMGMYVGGPFFLNSMLRIAQKGYPLTVVTPGNVIEDILRVVGELLPFFDQVILSGYPPFLRDVIERGKKAGIEWNKVRTILFPAGEGFSESWRQTVAQTIGNQDPVDGFFGYYGTADAAVLGVETPWSVLTRKAIAQNHKTVKDIFGESRLPSFMQYLPTTRYFEVINKELLFTTVNGCIPLVRYNIHDAGGLISHEQVMQIAQDQGLDMNSELAKRGYVAPWQLPYVYVFGRSDHTVILYGANIYPENIKTALENSEVVDQCTGKFMMETEEDHTHHPHLVIHIECAQSVEPTDALKDIFSKVIERILKEINSEYANAAKAIGKKAIPHIFLHQYQDEVYFPHKAKQQWKR